LLDWVASIQAGQPFHGASAWDGYVTMRVTAACIQSLHSGQVVPVQLPERPALYK
jgi:myo-inositol 2-dehydrogenase/D-chiro-inositol 1-dehydrogenase